MKITTIHETVIRIKRKRTEDPMNALLVHTEKKMKHQVYKLVESVEEHKITNHSPLVHLNRKRPLISVPEPVISSKKLKKAQQDRFKVVAEQKQSDGIKIVDIERDEPMDEITCNLMPMVREYLTISETERKPDEFVYDVYVHDLETGVNEALEHDRVGTIQLNQDMVFLTEDGPDSDFDSEDSNAEDYYTHEYPEEEDSDQVFQESDDQRQSSDDDYEHY